MRKYLASLSSKIASKEADTLVEALAALLIAALGATLLATMVMVSTNVSVTSRKSLSNLYKAETGMAESGVSGADFSFGKINIQVKVWTYQAKDDSGQVVFERYQNISARPENAQQ